jgi:hypothetical protein
LRWGVAEEEPDADLLALKRCGTTPRRGAQRRSHDPRNIVTTRHRTGASIAPIGLIVEPGGFRDRALPAVPDLRTARQSHAVATGTDDV